MITPSRARRRARPARRRASRTRSRSRRSSSRSGGRAAPGARTRCARSARRCGSTRWCPCRRRGRRRRRSWRSSSSDLNVPSSLAALYHGTLIAVGMWPARCACSCGRWAGASRRPANSSGLRTSTRFFAPMAATTSSRKARIDRSGSCATYWVAGRDGTSVTQRAGVQLPLLAAAVEQLHVARGRRA